MYERVRIILSSNFFNFFSIIFFVLYAVAVFMRLPRSHVKLKRVRKEKRIRFNARLSDSFSEKKQFI